MGGINHQKWAVYYCYTNITFHLGNGSRHHRAVLVMLFIADHLQPVTLQSRGPETVTLHPDDKSGLVI